MLEQGTTEMHTTSPTIFIFDVTHDTDYKTNLNLSLRETPEQFFMFRLFFFCMRVNRVFRCEDLFSTKTNKC